MSDDIMMETTPTEKKRGRRKYRIPDGMMIIGVQIPLDPTPRQMGLLASNAGAARYAYNQAYTHIMQQLAGCIGVQGDGKADWSLPALRRWWNEWKQELAPWWRDNSKEAYSSGLADLAQAFANYFDSRNGERGGERVGWPKRRAKNRSEDRFTYTTGIFGVIDDDPMRLKLPRIGRIHCLENVHRRLGDYDRILSMTIRLDHGRWWASLRVQKPIPLPNPSLEGSVGIDLNCGDNIMTLSDGTVIDNPKILKQLARKLAKAQRKLARKTKGSKRYKRMQQRINRIWARISALRNDLRHKLTTWIANTYAEISIEDLNVKGMTAKPQPKEDPNNPGHYLPNGRKAKAGLNKSILDVGFGEIRRQLEYKTATSGATLHIIDRFYPSSKTCSNCGTVKATLSLDERTFHCDNCGMELPRDLNAAININTAGSAPARNARGGTHPKAVARKDTAVPPENPTGKETRTVHGNPNGSRQDTELPMEQTTGMFSVQATAVNGSKH